MDASTRLTHFEAYILGWREASRITRQVKLAKKTGKIVRERAEENVLVRCKIVSATPKMNKSRARANKSELKGAKSERKGTKNEIENQGEQK